MMMVFECVEEGVCWWRRRLAGCGYGFGERVEFGVVQTRRRKR